MSSANESAAPAGTPAVDDASRLQQPSDAVPMASIPQSQSDSPVAPAAPASIVDDARATGNAASSIPEESSTSALATETTNEPANSNADPAPASPKGKDNSDQTPASPTRPKERSDSVLAIGPAQEDITMTPGGADGPVCQITLLLTTGTRHPYKIDARYLNRRNVPIPEENDAGQPDPFSISIYTLKELILREWRTDWEAKPASPSSIRLIHFGKLLDDKEQLRKYQFSTESPNVVHMSIRPQDLDEEEPKTSNKNAGAGGADSSRSRGTNCCVIL